MDTIGIALASYNGEKYISDQLDSLLQQTYHNFRCYIHDDGSSDSTVSIIDSYCTRYPDRFVRLDYPSMGGAACNFMSLLERIEDPYVMFCDQDDVWDEHKIEYSYERIRQIESSKGGHRPALVFCDLQVVDKDLHTIADSNYRWSGQSPYKTTLKELYVMNCAAGCTMMMNKTLRDIAIRVESVGDLIIHDAWLIMVASYTGEISYIDRSLIKYRQHGGNQIGANRSILLFKIKSALSVDSIQRISQRIRNHRQAIIRLNNLGLEGINDDAQAFIDEIVNIDKASKIKRMMFYRSLYGRTAILAIICC